MIPTLLTKPNSAKTSIRSLTALLSTLLFLGLATWTGGQTTRPDAPQQTAAKAASGSESKRGSAATIKGRVTESGRGVSGAYVMSLPADEQNVQGMMASMLAPFVADSDGNF